MCSFSTGNVYIISLRRMNDSIQFKLNWIVGMSVVNAFFPVIRYSICESLSFLQVKIQTFAILTHVYECIHKYSQQCWYVIMYIRTTDSIRYMYWIINFYLRMFLFAWKSLSPFLLNPWISQICAVGEKFIQWFSFEDHSSILFYIEIYHMICEHICRIRLLCWWWFKTNNFISFY